ncbi:MAG: hypothetical protein GY727_14130 [Gammaproteobacteria bacterium]|nr:hypothetical protein [Gammaproteobacteria bacterium]MCP4091099.1 hypothetical protein [Gammaproteobacteria bacterium]MCP4277375.1 hypothetical protein [Gammaproteobacteria bacterium]MCP4831564.1 hypothetical protein [Gammaproteobacteria bacterium]MCP4927787.1 hypothetical protein [Gammaproteobacteria bacterium]
MSILRLIILAISLVFSGGVFAVLEKIEEILELELRDVRLPSHEVDRVVVSQCDECTSLILYVTSETIYRNGGFDSPKISLQDFKAVVRKNRRKDEVLVYVGYVPDTKNISSIVISSDAE